MKCRLCECEGGHDAGCVGELHDRIAQLESVIADAIKLADEYRQERDADRAMLDKAQRERAEARRERDAAQDNAVSLLDWCKAWLIRARLAIYREGWEEGMSQAEAADALTSVLFNLRCDDGSKRTFDIAETKRLLAMPVTYVPPIKKGGA